MSYLSEQEIACAYCKHPNTAELWSVINVREDPELKDLFLGGEINVIECESCKEPFFAEQFLLYHDPDNELIAFVFPSDQAGDRDTLVKKAREDFDRSQSQVSGAEQLTYEPLAFFGLSDLLRFVEKDDEIGLQGEVAEAIAKENGLPFRKLRPSIARRQSVPRVLPFLDAPGRSSHEALVSGLRRLHELNDRLTVYNDTLDRIAKNPVDLQIA